MSNELQIIILWIFILYLLYQIQATNRRWEKAIREFRDNFIKDIDKLKKKAK